MPVNIFISTYDINPKAKPSVIEYVKSVNINVRNTGNPSVKSEKSIFVIGSIIKSPKTIKTGAVANAGIAVNIGEKNNDKKNNAAIVNPANPVLPPSAIPAADSMNATGVDVPKHAPIVEPTASAVKTLSAFLTLPFSSKYPAFEAKPIKVPILSNMSINNIVIITGTIPITIALLKSNCINTGATDGGSDTIPVGNCATPNISPSIYTENIPIINEPFTFFII